MRNTMASIALNDSFCFKYSCNFDQNLIDDVVALWFSDCYIFLAWIHCKYIHIESITHSSVPDNIVQHLTLIFK